MSFNLLSLPCFSYRMFAGSWQDLPTTRLSGVLINSNGENDHSAQFYSALRFFRKVTPASGGWDSVINVATRYLVGRFGFRTQVEGEFFRSCPDRPRGLPSVLDNGYWRWGGDVEHAPRLVTTLKKGYSYTLQPTLSLCIHNMLQRELYLFLNSIVNPYPANVENMVSS